MNLFNKVYLNVNILHFLSKTFNLCAYVLDISLESYNKVLFYQRLKQLWLVFYGMNNKMKHVHY